jgi:cytochrome b
MAFLFAFHGALSGAFLVSYLSGDEDTYGMHVFSGYALLAAIGFRVLVGLVAPLGSPLRLPRPSLRRSGDYLRRWIGGDATARRERSPLYAWMAAALLVGVGVAGLSGVAADFRSRLDDLHEALANASLFIVIVHVAIVLTVHGLKRLAAPKDRIPADAASAASGEAR